METKFGISYFMVSTNPGCSRTANNMRPSLPELVELIKFSVTSQFHCMQAITTNLLP